MAKNRHQLHVEVPVERGFFETLALGTSQSRAGQITAQVVAGMNAKAAERQRRVFEDPWLDRIDDPGQGVVTLHFIANTEPAR